MPARIIVAGGGFGGLYAARELERRLAPGSAEVTLINDGNFLLYAPLLPGVGGGTLEPRHVVVPLREELRGTEVRVGDVVGADPGRSILRVTPPAGETEELRYDHLIVALGSTSKHPRIPGLAEHALPFKSVADALALRNRVIASLERAEATDEPDERAAHLGYVFAGGGYTGVEAIAEIEDFAADVIGLYPRCARHGMRWTLAEGEPRIMSREMPPALSEFTTRELQSRGIEVQTGVHVDEVTERSVHLTTGETIPARTLVWTAGITPCSAVAALGLPLEGRGRITTDSRMRVEGHRNAWAIGDAAAVPDPSAPGDPCPQTAQFALRQGRAVARNVAAAVVGGEARPFAYRNRGMVVGLGRHKGVASVMGLKLRGFPAWCVARGYHLAAMPGTRRRARLLSDWTLAMLFARDSAELGTPRDD
ncbi:MAG: NAD(P)/FAD-dependent oxidoreductase [Solirubrobacterales bacterium]